MNGRFIVGSVPWNKGTKGLVGAWNIGRPKSAETKRKISETLKRKGIAPPGGWNKGLKHSEETKAKMRAYHSGRPKPYMKERRGEKHPRWVGDRSVVAEKHRMRSSSEWRAWREAVFKRDGYVCMECGDGGYLEPNHIIPLRVSMERIFDVSNGISLCRPCHIKTIWKEEEFAQKYTRIVAGR